jgi:hypothetical protein
MVRNWSRSCNNFAFRISGILNKMPLFNPGVGSSVQTSEIEDGQITTAKLANGAVTVAKTTGLAGDPGFQVVAEDTTIGNYTSPNAAVGTSEQAGTALYTDADNGGNMGTNATITRLGETIKTGHASIGQTAVSIKMYLKKTNTPTDTVYCRVYNSSNVLQATFGSMSASDLTTSYIEYTFSGATHVIAAGDKFVAETTAHASNGISLSRASSNNVANAEATYYNGSWVDLATNEAYMTIYSVVPAIDENIFDDDETGSHWESDAEANPAIYVDQNGAAVDAVGIAIYLHANTTETEISIAGSTTTSFAAGDLLRTILVSALTTGAWNYIRFNRPLVKKRYFQIRGTSGNSLVLAISEVKILQKTESEMNRQMGFHPISNSDNSLDVGGD